MHEMGLRAKIRRKRFKPFPRLGNERCEDLIQRQFKPNHPNQKWYTDVSAFIFKEIPLYL